MESEVDMNNTRYETRTNTDLQARRGGVHAIADVIEELLDRYGSEFPEDWGRCGEAPLVLAGEGLAERAWTAEKLAVV
jgi:hypothetical protein